MHALCTLFHNPRLAVASSSLHPLVTSRVFAPRPLLCTAPLVYVNDHFCRMSGFTSREVLGRSCRFLQGPETEPEAVSSMLRCLSEGLDCHVKLTNYRKDGSLFVNLLSMRSIHDSNGVYRFVVAIQNELASDTQGRTKSVLPAHAFEWHLRVFEQLPTTMAVRSRPFLGHTCLSACAPRSDGLLCLFLRGAGLFLHPRWPRAQKV